MQLPIILLMMIISAAPCASATRYALIAGQNNGGKTVDDLHYAEMDAKRFAGLLQEYGGVASENIRVLLHPDSMALIAAGERLVAEIAAEDDPQQVLVFFYYSGHADGEGLLLDSSHVAFGTLRHLLSRIPAGIRIAIFDACQSGAAVAFKGGMRAEPFFLANQQKSKGEIWIASSSASERAQESESLKSSLFSFHLFNGLRGSADVSGENRVTANEAYQYAYRKTLETSALTTGILQHPVYRFNISGEGDIVLTDLTGRKGGIVVDGSCKGTFLVLSRTYTEVYADFSKEAGKETFIALESGDYSIINARGAADIGMCQFTVNGPKTVRCSAGMFHASLLQESRIKGGSAASPVNNASPSTALTSRAEDASRYSWGAGAGVEFVNFASGSALLREPLLSLHGSWLLAGVWKLFFSGYGSPVIKHGGIDAGIGRTCFLRGGYYFFGGGCAVDYLHSSGISFDQSIGAGMVIEAGVSVAASPVMQMGFHIPWHIMYRSGITQSLGLELRVQFSRGTREAAAVDSGKRF